MEHRPDPHPHRDALRPPGLGLLHHRQHELVGSPDTNHALTPWPRTLGLCQDFLDDGDELAGSAFLVVVPPAFVDAAGEGLGVGRGDVRFDQVEAHLVV